jgi:hypothetical protein
MHASKLTRLIGLVALTAAILGCSVFSGPPTPTPHPDATANVNAGAAYEHPPANRHSRSHSYPDSRPHAITPHDH